MFKNLNLQLLSEAEDAAAEAGADGGAEEAGAADGSQNAGVNTEEMKRIAQERTARAEKAALKSYLKQQGLSEKEAQEAFEAFKTQKAEAEEAERNDLTTLQQKLSQYEQGTDERVTLANRRLIRAEAMVQAMGLDIRADRVEHAIRLADLSNVEIDENGRPDEAAIQEALKKVTQEIPELLSTYGKAEDRAGFKLGGPGASNEKSTNEALAKIFGNSD